MIKMTKGSLRKKLLKKLKRQKEVERFSKSFRIQKKLFSLPEFKRAKMVLFYMWFNGEVETFRMIERAILLGKQVALPVMDRRRVNIAPFLFGGCAQDLEEGFYGIMEPKANTRRKIPLSKIDLVVVPAVAFDLIGNRIGRGKGYYDRFLSALPSKTPTVGISFDFQVLSSLPTVESHDFSVDKVLCS